MIDEDQFLAWKQEPVTKAFFELLKKKREAMKDQWEAGVFSDDTPEKYALKSLAAMQECKAYALVADIDYTDFLTEAADGQQVRAKTPRSSGAN